LLGIGDPSGLEKFSAAAMVVMTLLAGVFSYSKGGLTRREGVAIITLYAAFVLVMIAAA
jgi:Ca2+/Na+ antiporter